MSYRKVDYFEAARVLTTGRGCVLADLDARMVPIALSALETRKGRSFWATPDDWSTALTELCRAQEALLMSCTEDIIREIRASRGSYQGAIPTDTTTYPVGTFPGVSLVDIAGAQYNTDGRPVGILLGSIEAILQAQAAGEANELEALLQIVALLSA